MRKRGTEVDVETEEEADKKTHWTSANDRLKYSGAGAGAGVRGVGSGQLWASAVRDRPAARPESPF